MPQLLGSLRGQFGGVVAFGPSLAVTLVELLPFWLETVLAPNPLRANASTNPRINKASMGGSPLRMQAGHAGPRADYGEKHGKYMTQKVLLVTQPLPPTK